MLLDVEEGIRADGQWSPGVVTVRGEEGKEKTGREGSRENSDGEVSSSILMRFFDLIVIDEVVCKYLAGEEVQ